MKASERIEEIFIQRCLDIGVRPRSTLKKRNPDIVAYLDELEERVKRLEEMAYPVLTKAVSPIDCPMCHGMIMGCSHTWCNL